MAGRMSIPYKNLYHCLCNAGWKDVGCHVLLDKWRLQAGGSGGRGSWRSCATACQGTLQLKTALGWCTAVRGVHP